MAQVILIENNKTLHELLAINLTTFLGIELIPRNSAEEAIHLLDILPQIDVVITRETIEAESSAQLLCDYVLEKNLNTEIIILGSDNQNFKHTATLIPNANDWENVVRVVQKSIGINDEMIRKKMKPEYIGMSTSYFLPITSCCCDIFLRIKKGPNEFQYIKRVHAGDSYSRAMVTKYIEQGVKLFYIAEKDHKNFANFISNQLVQLLENSLSAAEPDLELIGESYDIALNEIKEMGFTTASIELTNTIVTSMIQTFENSPIMSPLLHKIINSRSSYMYQHCHLISVVAAQCLKYMTFLPGQQEENQRKLAYAAFFHDISLIDHDEYVRIHDQESFESAELSEEDWDLVFNHALEAAILVRGHHEAPIGIDTIIKEHHGVPNGKGFCITPRNILSPLSRVFIIAEEFSMELLSYTEKRGKPLPIVKKLYEKYPTPEFMEIIAILEKSLRKRGAK